jgi:ABC-type antimicrobial peptide transport system permease subunit
MYPAFSLTTTLGYALLVVVIAAVASFFPAWQASRKEPAEALHHI